jgi:hypothetical protein
MCLMPACVVCGALCVLSAGTVLKLGTEKHHQGLLRGIDNMTEVGCFALTELGFGGCRAREWFGDIMPNKQPVSGAHRQGECHGVDVV